MQFFNDNQCQSKEYTGATEKVGSVLGGRSFSLMTPTNNGHTIRLKSEDCDEEEQVVLSAFPAESNGGDDTVGTNGQPIPEYTLPLHLCPALQWILHLCRGSEQRASQATVPLCRPACPTPSDQRCCLLSRPMMPNAINNGNLSLQSF